jgi:hypothetical protein
MQFFSFPWQGGSCAAARMTRHSGAFDMPSPVSRRGHRCGRRGRRGARRELVFRAHRFPAQLCEQDFDAYETEVISDESMNRVASLLDNESPRAPDPRR